MNHRAYRCGNHRDYYNSTLILAYNDSIVLYDTCRLGQHILFTKPSLILSDHQVICTACTSDIIGLNRTVACRQFPSKVGFSAFVE